MMGARWVLIAFYITALGSYCNESLAAPAPAANPVVAERPIPFKSSDETDTGALVFRVVLVLGLVLAIGVVALLVLRKYIPMTSALKAPGVAREIELVELRRLSPRLTLYLIEVHGTRYLLAQSGDRLVPLSPAPPKA